LSSGLVFDIKRYAIHDGPGIRTTVFFKGCSLQCWWCHNPESQRKGAEVLFRTDRCIGCGLCASACPNAAISAPGAGVDSTKCMGCGTCAAVCPSEALEIVGRTMTVGDVMQEIERDVLFYDESGGGVTFSGGDPLAQPNFLEGLLDACQEKGIHTAVDTAGHVDAKLIQRLAHKVDLFLYDLKHMDPKRHMKYTGVSNEIILRNLKLLAESGANINVRIPLIQGVNDDRENIVRTRRFLNSLPGIRDVSILPYHGTAAHKYEGLGRDYCLAHLRKPSEEKVNEVSALLAQSGLHVKVGG